MSWLDRLRPATFRGVMFHVERAGRSGGRRLVRHEYPGRDRPATEDLGRLARGWRVEGYLLGDDYDLEVGRLVHALETRGAGELVLPHLGTLEVVVESFEVVEVRTEGRLARISVSYVEPGEVLEPVGAVDGAASSAAAALAAQAAADGALPGKLSLLQVPGFVLDAVTGAVRTAENYLIDLTLDGAPGEVRRLLDSVEGLADRSIDLLTDPDALAGSLTDTVRRISSGFSSRLDAFRALDGMHDLESATPVGTGALQEDAAGNGVAIIDHFGQVAISEQVRIAGELVFESLEDALELVDGLEARAEALLPTLTDPEVTALSVLLDALRRAVPPPGETLPRLAEITPRATTPALVLSYGLWDDRGRSDEIVDRNNVRRPGLVPGGEPLAVLNV